MKGLKLLQWKNWKIESRNKVQFLIELLAPVSFAIFACILRAAVIPTKIPNATTYEPFKIRGNVPTIIREQCNTVYYTPVNPLTDKLVGSIVQNYFAIEGLNYTFEGFSTKNELIQSYMESVEGFDDIKTSTSPVLAGIIFDKLGSTKLSQHIKYTLKFPSFQRTEYEALRERGNFNPSWNPDLTYPTFRMPGPRARKSNVGGFPGYFEEGFLYLQYAIDASITKLLLNDTQLGQYEKYELQLQRFPFPAFSDDLFNFITQFMLPFLLVASMIYPIMNLSRQIVHEKSTRLKEMMKILGLSNWLHWTSWFIRSIIVSIISSALMVFFLKLQLYSGCAVFVHGDPVIIFLVFLCYSVNWIGFSFFMSTLFGVAETAATVVGLLSLLQFLPYIKTFAIFGVMSRTSKILYTIFNINVPISFAMFVLAELESYGTGIQWDNIKYGTHVNDNFTMIDIMGVMIFNGVFYMLLAFYIEVAFPGQFGVPLPWYFPFTKWYWTGQPRSSESEASVKPKKLNQAIIEKEPKGLKAGVVIKGLTKVFGKKVAVNNVSFNMFEGQVTSLLGPNGAGKTTTMSILTGLFTPSNGTALVNSFDIRKDMPAIRSSLGLCPQHNVLFDSLTVEEHLKFYSTLKGYNAAETIEEIERMLDVLELQDKRKAESKNLSGGMKRKLSVGIAFCAGSKVVLLDEPTAGMDVNARRSTWDLIQAEKIGRTVILSTHYMQGGDYNLTIVKTDTCSSTKIRETIDQIIPGVVFNQDVGAEISLTLPIENVNRFPLLFQELDDRSEELGIGSYGVGSTSMEEIFMRVGIAAEDTKNKKRGRKKCHDQKGIRQSQTSIENLNYNHYASTEEIIQRYSGQAEKVNSGISIIIQQFRAMLTKRILMTIRNYQLLLVQVIVPSLVLLAMSWLINAFPGIKRAGPLASGVYETNILDDTSILINCQGVTQLCQKMKLLANHSHTVEEISESSLSSFLIESSEKSVSKVNYKYMVGFEQDENNPQNVIGFFNNQQFHVPPLALNFLTNSILSSFDLHHQISVTNYPFEYTALDELRSPGMILSPNLLIAICSMFGIAFGSSAFVILPTHERVTKFKHLQLIAGIRITLYWIANFLIDILICVGSTVTLAISLQFFENDIYTSWEMLLKYMFLTLLNFWITILLCAYLSTFCTRPATVYARLIAIQIVASDATTFLMSVLQCPEFHFENAYETAHEIMMWIPCYAAPHALISMGRNSMLNKYCRYMDLDKVCEQSPNEECCTRLQSNYFAWEPLGAGQQIMHMCVVGTIFFLLLVIQESGIIRKMTCRKKKLQVPGSSANGALELTDINVLNEKKRIHLSTITQLSLTDNLILRDLCKVYKKTLMAVNNLSLGVKKGEIFGLLGVNGAGKTTTFKMLTGDIAISQGDAYICSYSVRGNLKKARSFMGYCPQFDACIEQLTARETLTLFARLKGIKEKNISEMVNRVGHSLLFSQFLDKQCGTYSGGNKRKLSTAVSMIGEPAIIFLDEPTAGMDPVARRHVWNAISQVRDSGTSVVISSHNMEECQALCSQLAIMVKGQFQCVGSPQHLRSKLCQGFNLVAQLNSSPKNHEMNPEDTLPIGYSDWDVTFGDFNKFIREQFPGCQLKDSHTGFVQYLLPYESTNWAKMFTVMEEAKDRFGVDAYSLGQIDLENVFFSFLQQNHAA